MVAVNRYVYSNLGNSYGVPRTASDINGNVLARGRTAPAGALGYGSANYFGDGFVGPRRANPLSGGAAQASDTTGVQAFMDAIKSFFSRLFGGGAPKIGAVNEFEGSRGGTPTIGVDPGGTPNTSSDRGKTWDVFFDSKEGTRTQQRSPIVLDLNGNGKADITGANIKGDGKIDGSVKGFDLNPEARQWQYRSKERRPGKGAPKLPAGSRMDVFDAQGNLVRSVDVPSKLKGKAGLAPGERAEFRGPDGKLVGELKSSGNGKYQYYWGNKNENEWVKPWDAQNGGDGLLAWDVDGDGKITSGKELMGTVDLDGKNKFNNGYEKLAKYFDQDGNGKVEGAELNGLKIWEDRNGDGVTQDGELVDLASHGVTSLDTSFDPDDMSSSYKK